MFVEFVVLYYYKHTKYMLKNKVNYQQNRGLIIELVLIIVALVILKFYFDVDIVKFLKSDFFQNAVDYLKEIIKTLIDNFK
jgi:hypothetical protein